MLPAATNERSPREVNKGRPGGRTQEIQRLIGRSLRSVTDLSRLGERTITVDCDVLQADAGTRTASITGGYVALAIALRGLAEQGLVPDDLLIDCVAAVSVGIVDERGPARPLLRRGRGRRGRLQRRDDRVGRLRGGAGDRRGHAVQPRPARRAARPGRRRHRRPDRDPAQALWAPEARRDGLPRPRRDRLTERAQAPRARPDLPGLARRVGHRRDARSRRLPRRRGDRGHLPRERPAEGARRRAGARRARDRRRLRDRGRRARREARARGAPATRGTTPPTSRTSTP